MSATIPAGRDLNPYSNSWLSWNSVRMMWPYVAAGTVMLATIILGTQSRPARSLTMLSSTSARGNAAPMLRSSQYRIEREHGYLSLSGSVANLTSRPFKNVEALVELFDHDGLLVKSETALIELPSLRVGEDSPFTIQTRDSPTIESYRIRFRELLSSSIPSIDR